MAGGAVLVAGLLAVTVGVTALVQTAGGADFTGPQRQARAGQLLTVADFDGANGLDLIGQSDTTGGANTGTQTTTEDPGVFVFRRQRNGTFVADPLIRDVANAEAAAVGNFTGDGRRDVALFGSDEDFLAIDGFPTTGVGTRERPLRPGGRYLAAAPTSSWRAGKTPRAGYRRAVGLLAAEPLRLGHDPMCGRCPDMAVAGRPARLALADLDGDGLQDVIAGGTGGVVALLWQRVRRKRSITTAATLDLTHVGKLDGDGTRPTWWW